MSEKKHDPLDELGSTFDELQEEAEAELKRAEEQLRSLRSRPPSTGAPPTKRTARASASYNIGPDEGGDPDAESGGPEPPDPPPPPSVPPCRGHGDLGGGMRLGGFPPLASDTPDTSDGAESESAGRSAASTPPADVTEPGSGDDRGFFGRFLDWMQREPGGSIKCAATIASKTPPESTDPHPRASNAARASRGVNRIRIIFMASYEVGRAAAIAAMHGDGAEILAEGARKLTFIDSPGLKSTAAELSAISGNWAGTKHLISGVFHSRIQKADDGGPLYHAASCAYLLGTMREFCQGNVGDFPPERIAGEINKAKDHAGVLCDLQCSTFARANAEQKFGAVESPIRETKKDFQKRLQNHVQFIDNLKGIFGNSLA